MRPKYCEIGGLEIHLTWLGREFGLLVLGFGNGDKWQEGMEEVYKCMCVGLYCLFVVFI